jgi:PhzF family phenazine biosynthesis protein
MRLRLWQVDAFAERVFTGNPAAVCPLEGWLPDETLAGIAAENNLSETAFLVRAPAGGWDLRWFTPVYEVDLCGHATLASAHVVFTHLDPGARSATFRTRSGPLTVERRDDGLLAMTFPRKAPEPCPIPEAVVRALSGVRPAAAFLARDTFAVLDSEAAVRAAAPDLSVVKALPGHGLVLTAPATTPGIDFVSRFFAPQAGIDEDPVTGSVHCALIPYWAARLGKRRLEGLQVSRRGGRLSCEDRADAVGIAGRAVQYLEGWIDV